MMKRIAFGITLLVLPACAVTTPNINRSELSNARSAIAAAKAAGAERCAPEHQAKAVASLYWAAHEYSEGNIHPDEDAQLTATAESEAKKALEISRHGCKREVAEVINLPDVHFAHNSAKLTASSSAVLDRAVATLKARKGVDVEVAAYTDSDGSADYNLALSNRRAASVLDYLVAHGVNKSRLSSKGFGESDPVASNATPKGKAMNRRVELHLLK